MAYAYGYTDYDDIQPIIEDSGLLHFSEQVKEVKKKQTRTPKLVVDIGAGRGDLAAAFLSDGVPCIPVDPAPGPAEIIPETMKKWGDQLNLHVKERMYSALHQIMRSGLKPDTITICATLEHIPKEEFYMSLPLIKEILTETHGLLIITSFIDYHPIEEGLIWCHIHGVDDDTYNAIEAEADRLIFRRGSHLVVGW